MKIALDYDNTFNLDRDFWTEFAEMAEEWGHEVRIVTARSPTDDRLASNRVAGLPVVYCDGIAKRFFCRWFVDKTATDVHGWNPDIWIDDKPESIGQNSSATEEILKNWRASPEYLK